MPVGLFHCPHCEDNGTKLLISINEVAPEETPEVKYFCENCNQEVIGKLIKYDEGTITIESRDNTGL